MRRARNKSVITVRQLNFKQRQVYSKSVRMGMLLEKVVWLYWYFSKYEWLC
jgi:hypothetical protein